MTRDVRIALYGDVNLNVLDGSAVWLQSAAIALSRLPRISLTVVLKSGEQRDLLTAPLRRLPHVRVVNPVDEGRYPGPDLTRNEALDTLEALDREQRFDGFILRGLALCHAAAIRKRRTFTGRIWAYLTDFPQRSEELTAEALGQLDAISAASRYLLCQTEALRSFLEAHVPESADRAILLEPMIPDEIPARAPPPAPLGPEEPLRLIYVGKYAPAWHTLEMTAVTAELRAEGVPVELHMVGDKIHRPKPDPTFHERMEHALSSTPGVRWHRGRSREETLVMLAGQHVALGWRAPDLDDSLELSTKLLEYGAVGVPALVNRNPMHEDLLGADYPLFAGTRAEFKDAVQAARDPEVRRLAAERCATASRAYTFSAVAARLAPYVDRAVPPRDLRGQRPRALRVLVACHDFKFFTRIQEHLAAIRGVELRLDAWDEIDRHDPVRSEELLGWADVIVCEWCANNAVWYAERKRPGQRLVVRLHRFELYAPYVQNLAFENVDQVVFVGDFYRDEARSRLGWAPEKLVVIPNWVDTRLLDRPKLGSACFNLGMIGIAPMRKRLDRGLNVLERLRAVDERFQLYVKSKLPWDYWWIWRKPEEQTHYREVFRRINASPHLRGAVHFDPFGPEVAVWLRKIGFVLSTSDDESFHLAPAEGMASRALPAVLAWQGASAIYPEAWVHEDEDRMVDAILGVLEGERWQADGEEARAYIERRYSVEKVCAAWEELVCGNA